MRTRDSDAVAAYRVWIKVGYKLRVSHDPSSGTYDYGLHRVRERNREKASGTGDLTKVRIHDK